jgi:tripartite-type tricarboxylate transporter receptor subunit TctC
MIPGFKFDIDFQTPQIMRSQIRTFVMVCVFAFASNAPAQNYPVRPVHMITTGVGGALDFTARITGQGISGPLGQPVVVDNRGSVIIAAQVVAKALPDGYTLLVMGTPLWIGPLLEKLSYDPIRDFSPITNAGITPNVLVVHPSLPVKSVPDVIALAKSKPGAINYASSITGGATHLASELFKSMAHVNIERINYKSSGLAIRDLLGGQVQLMFGSGTGITPHIKSGRVRALAVTTAQPSSLFSELPTVATFLPGYESALIVGIFAPANTPPTIISRLNHEIIQVLTLRETREKFANFGSEVVASTPDQLTATIKSEITRIGQLIKDAGIRAD